MYTVDHTCDQRGAKDFVQRPQKKNGCDGRKGDSAIQIQSKTDRPIACKGEDFLCWKNKECKEKLQKDGIPEQ